MTEINRYELDTSDRDTAKLLASDAYRQDMLTQELKVMRDELGIPQDEKIVIYPWVPDKGNKLRNLFPSIWASVAGNDCEPKYYFEIERANTKDRIRLPVSWLEERGLSTLLNYWHGMQRFIGAKVRLRK